MEREQLMAQLKQGGIDFPETATLEQLQELVKQIVGASKSSAPRQPTNESSTSPLASMATATTPTVQTNTDTSWQAHMAEEGETDVTELRRKLRILMLEKEIRELERYKEEPKKSVATFADIQGTLPKFTGDDEYTITKWVSEFDKVTNVVGCTAADKFLFARRMMAGSAALFLRNAKSESWEGLKEELCAEFRKTVGVKEILKKLDNRKWNRATESLHRYVLVMQELAEGAPINEKELVEFIIEGMQEKSVAASIFFSTTTISDFKDLIPRYEKMTFEKSQRQLKGSLVDHTLAEVRCFNCQKLGHYANSCTKEKRQTGACFKCGRTGHLRFHCPLRAVAAVPQEEELNWNAEPM
ncbi:uncharacterized protein [Musca autumnalis]|uniref:uncharacterized protein n=1 Tax=Musca autumnalis TaxID=221902 RepID=UPI003CEDA7F5